MRKGDEIDPKGLIAESYRIENITPEECRSVFLDWALALSTDQDQTAALRILLDRHGAEVDHPMTTVLKDGLEAASSPRRRGGWRSRRPN